ncbi:MAG TPA: TetR/AcrR family transcriptional regulator [Verrucomicrobiae bacterium]|nr:TetR/AcrR family transcriptional regulator [Verrucomicrobiae bacterium]
MRVTAETQAATRARILKAARQLLAERDFESMTTRDIAHAARIAVGTVFNYFASKEAIVASLASEAIAAARTDFAQREAEAESVQEALFTLVAGELRRLKPLREHLPAVLETLLSPLTAGGGDGEWLRVSHLETVVRLCQKHGHGELSPVAVNMYWSLYIGLLQFWARDKSPRQEDTLALLDHSLEMFSGWLESRSDRRSTESSDK